MNLYKKYQSSFNHFPLHRPKYLSRPEHYTDLEYLSLGGIARGSGCSYGDAPLNKGGHVILTERLDRFLIFDKNKGILCAEAGIRIAKILELIIPYGWFLPVTPGTSFATLGGCVAADVHGKNHYHKGSISEHILSLELITAEGERINCSPNILSDLFWATIGGMGLTSIIGTITLKLKPIKSTYLIVKHKKTENLKQSFEELFNEVMLNEYTVAWLDFLDPKRQRGIVISAKHADVISLPSHQQSIALSIPKHKFYKIPFYFPQRILCPTGVKLFNKYYYQRLASKSRCLLMAYDNYFYPLDRILNWPRLYGKRGFLQYQCILPTEVAYSFTQEILKILKSKEYPIYLAVLKYFGKGNLAPLAFSMPGFSLALDIPIVNSGLFACLDELDELVVTAKGRIYLAKDFRLKSDIFRVMYPRYSEWLTIKQRWDPNNKFNSSLSRRLKIF